MSFVRSTGVRGLEEVVLESIPKQEFVDTRGLRQVYAHSCSSNSGWISKGIKSKAGRTRVLCGDALVYGSMSNLTKSLHRALRIAVLMKRYAARMYRAIHKCGAADAIFGSEKPVVFVVAGEIVPDVVAKHLPSQHLNSLLPPSGVQVLEDHVLQVMEGEVYVPSDDRLRELLLSDPSADPVGLWRIFLESEHNGTPFPYLEPGANRDQFALLLMLKMVNIMSGDLLISPCSTPLE